MLHLVYNRPVSVKEGSKESSMVPIRERVNDIMIVSLVARIVISILGGFVFGFVGWLIAWLLMPYLEFTDMALPLAGTVVLGIATSVTAAAVFWDAYGSPARKTVYVASVIGGTMAACMITFTIAMSSPKYIYITRGVIFPMINIGTFTATLIAAGYYLHRQFSRTGE